MSIEQAREEHRGTQQKARAELRDMFLGRGTGSLHGLRGEAVARVRRTLEVLVSTEWDREQGPSRLWLSTAVERIEQCESVIHEARWTPTHVERLPATRDRLGSIRQALEAAGDALQDAEAAKRATAAERWPTNKDRTEEIEAWGRTLELTLEFRDNLTDLKDRDRVPDDFDRESVVTILRAAETAYPDLKDDLELAVTALDNGDFTGAWIILYTLRDRFMEGVLERSSSAPA